ncbi:MAG: ABC transporter permease [Cyanobacteriota bacterium]|nr:ABC transporter permease [Cyanobacteriota bacterium]
MPLLLLLRLWNHHELIACLTQREILLRYRGSLLGWGWTLLNPLMMLAIYTFVFSTIFKARWESTDHLGPEGFALNIFAGMVVFNLFAECANKAPALITSNRNYVTKIRFPLETLGCSTLLSSLFHACTSLIILLIFRIAVMGSIPWKVLLLPVVWLPYLLLTLAGTWLLAALGVYLKDLNQFMVIVTTALTFLSGIFYPLSALPSPLIPIFRLNPLATWVEQTRGLLIMNDIPSALQMVAASIGALVACELSLRLFKRASLGFADVL